MKRSVLCGLVIGLLWAHSVMALKFEVQTLTLTDTVNFTSVNFQQVYDELPVVFVMASEENPDPATVRIRNVSTSGFELAQVEPEGRNASGLSASMTVQYLAIEPGQHTLADGTEIDVGVHVTSNSVYYRDGASYDAINFDIGFSATPVLLSQIQTMTNEIAVPPISNYARPWITATTQNLSSSGFQLILDRSEVNGGTVTSVETVGWLAIARDLNGVIESQAGDIDFLTSRFTNIQGWGNNGSCYASNLSRSFNNIQVIGGKNTRNGNNGGWGRRCLLSSNRIGFVTDEDQDRDAERNHIAETFGFIAFDDAFVYDDIPSCGIWRDEFGTVSYANNNGDAPWLGDWVEQDSSGGGAASGQVQVNAGQLRLQGNNQGAYANVNKVTRAVDLTGRATATVSFDFETSASGIEADDEVWFQVSSDGGINFTTLETFLGPGSGSRSFDISGFATASTQIRFAIAPDDNTGSCCYGASAEWFYVDDIQVEACGASQLLVDHYALLSGSAGLTCEPQSVTLVAHDVNHLSVEPLSGTRVDLSTSTGRGIWSGTSVDDGAASYVFDGSTSSVNLSILHAVTGVVNIDTNAGSSDSPLASEDPDIDFADAGLRLIDAGGGAVDGQIAGKPSENLFIEAVRRDDVTQQCTALYTNQAATLDFAAECVAPAQCTDVNTDSLGDFPLVLDDSSGSLSVPTTAEDGGASAIQFSALRIISFDGSGRASVRLRYDDAGQVALLMRSEIIDSAGVASGEFLLGSATFGVAPAGLCVEALDMDGSGTNSPQCLTASAGCSVYQRAGLGFDMRVSAKRWQDDAEVDSEFCDNATTPNFELPGIALTSQRLAPVTGRNATLSAATASIVNDGAIELVQTVDEVGVFSIEATATVDYLGTPINPSRSAEVGRFIPSHFVIENEGVTPAAGTLSYLDQPFDARFDIRAVNVAGTTTENYRDDFRRLDLAGDLSFGAVDDAGGTATSLNSRIAYGAPSATWANGEAIIASIPLTISRGIAVDGPYAATRIGVLALDDDGVGLLSAALDLDTEITGSVDRQWIHSTDLDFRYGRVYVPPVYGPEVPSGLTTQAPLLIEYWDGTSFVTNADDSATTIDAFSWSSASNCVDPDSSDSLACVDTTVTIAAGSSVLDGQGSISVDRPGSSGELSLELVVDPWFQFDWQRDWDLDTVLSDDLNPSFPLTFGSYRAHDRIIYWREL